MDDSAIEVLQKLSKMESSEHWKIIDTYPLPFFRIEIHDRDPKRGESIKWEILKAVRLSEAIKKIDINSLLEFLQDGIDKEDEFITKLKFIKRFLQA